MLGLVMESQHWFLCLFEQKSGKPHLKSMEYLPVTHGADQLANAQKILNPLQLQQYSQQDIVIGLTLKDLHYLRLAIPGDLKTTDYEDYCRLTMSQRMKSPSTEIAVDFQMIAEKELFAVSCHRSLILALQQLCHQAKLSLIRCDINFYALVTALSHLGYISQDEWQLADGIVIQTEQELMLIQLDKDMIVQHEQLRLGSKQWLNDKQISDYWQQFSGFASQYILYVNPVIAYQQLSQYFSQGLVTEQNSLSLMVAYGLVLRAYYAGI